jgi:transcriptional regulator with XRE-family HTH domain
MNDTDQTIAPDLDNSGSFAVRLWHARHAIPLTQEELAARAGIPGGQTTIAHYEAGRREPGLDNLRRLVWALGDSADYLLATRPGTDDDYRPAPPHQSPLDVLVTYAGGDMSAAYRAPAGASPKEAMVTALAEWPDVTRVEVVAREA